MKKIFLIFLCLLLSSSLLAQTDTASFKLPGAIIKISPLQFLTRTFELGIEGFNPTYSSSLNITAGVKTGSDDFRKGFGGGVELAYRKYVAPMKFRSRNNRDSYQGIYYSLFFEGKYFQGEDLYDNSSNNYTERITSIASGFTIGFQKTLWQILILDVYVGGGYRQSHIKTSGSYYSSRDRQYYFYDPGYTGIYPKTGVKIGIGL